MNTRTGVLVGLVLFGSVLVGVLKAVVVGLAPGDVTNDGRVSATDALAILAHVVGSELPSDFVLDPNGDVNCKDGATSLDALLVLSYVVGRISDLVPFCESAGVVGRIQMGPDASVDTLPVGFIGQVAFSAFDAVADTVLLGLQRPVWWTVSDPAVLGVDSTHTVGPLVRGVFRSLSPGTVMVTARVDGKEDSLTVTVVPWNPTGLGVSPQSPRFVEGDQQRFTATAVDGRGYAKPAEGALWGSSNAAVITIDSGAIATALLAGGAQINATWEGLSGASSALVITQAQFTTEKVSTSFQDWFGGQYNQAPGPALSVMANEHTASWGNFGMNDLGRQPREPFNNDPSYSYAYVAELPWTVLHGVLSDLREASLAIAAGVPIGAEGADTEAARAWVPFVRGLTLGALAQLFDRAFVLDEERPLDASLLRPYQDVLLAGLAELDRAITLSSQGSFQIPVDWAGGGPALSNFDLVRLANSHYARFLATVPRTPTERGAVDWNLVLTRASAGIVSDFYVVGVGTGGAETWGDWTKTWGGTYSSWARADVEYIGPADQSGAFQAWIATPVQSRNAILIDTDDARVTQPASPQSDGRYMTFEGLNSSAFRPERGTYRFSDYRVSLHDDYALDWTGPAIILNVAEMDFLKAEAHLRLGDVQSALGLINPYRVGNGLLPELTATGAEGPRCVPRDATTGTCGDLWASFRYEKSMETFHFAMGTAFFDDRGFGTLLQGTPEQFPIPGAVLLELGLPTYTFGGGEGPRFATRPGQASLERGRLARYWETLRERRAELKTEAARGVGSQR
jgi:hypothetical protein